MTTLQDWDLCNLTRVAESAFTAFGVKAKTAAMHRINDCLNSIIVNEVCEGVQVFGWFRKTE